MNFKAQCKSGNGLKYVFVDEKCVVGKTYIVEMIDAESKSLQQNKTYWALLHEFMNSGCSSFDNIDIANNHFKKIAGIKGFSIYVYFANGQVIQTDKKPEFEHKEILIAGSFSKATLKQAKIAIDTLIKEMVESGVNTDKFEEIMRGLERGD